MQTKRTRPLSIVLILALLLSLTIGTGTTAFAQAGPTMEELVCTHEHGEACGYMAAVEGTDCTFEHTHDDACSFDGEDAESCTFDPASHEHDGECNYIAAVEGQPCAHSCKLCEEETEGDEAPAAATGTITGFELAEVNVEQGTLEADLGLPGEVTATVQPDGEGAEPTTVTVGVGAWVTPFWSTPYDPTNDVLNIFVYEADPASLTLPDDITLPDDAEMPLVRVTVGEVETEIVAFATNHDINSGILIISDSGEYVVTGTTTTNRIVVQDGASPTITLNNVSIQSGNAFSALELQGNANVSLKLQGESTLQSGANKAGLQVQGNAAITIDSATTHGSADGTLNAYSNGYGAGIGGSDTGSGGTITINGGTVNAYSSNSGAGYGAGIGGGGNSSSGSGGDGGNITITGGVVNAYSSKSGNLGWGAGIGGGNGGEGGTIEIKGGTVEAYAPVLANFGGSGIGGGYGKSDTGTITIDYTGKTGASVLAKGISAFGTSPTQTNVQSYTIGSGGTRTDGTYTYASGDTEVTLYSDAVGGGTPSYTLYFRNGALRTSNADDGAEYTGKGTTWTATADTLTLTDFTFTTTANIGLNVQSDVTVTLNGSNSITSGSGSNSYGLIKQLQYSYWRNRLHYNHRRSRYREWRGIHRYPLI